MNSQKTIFGLSACLAFQMTGFVIVLPLFARRFESFGAGVQALGTSAMAYALTSTIAAPFVGILADRFGRRPIILLSLVASVLVFSGYLFAEGPWQLIVLRGLAGVLTAGLLPAITSMVGDLAPQDQRGRWMGIVSGGASAGWIVGPLVGGILYDRFGYGVPFTASILLAACALLLAIFWIPETRLQAARPRQERRPGLGLWKVLPAQQVFTLPLLIAFGVMFAWAFIEPQFMFYVYDDLSWTSAQLGWVMSAYGLAFMLGEFTLGQLSDRLGRKPVLIAGLLLFSAQFIGLAVFCEAAWIVVSFILAGLGNALYDPALSALILDLAPPEHTASLLGLKSTAGSLGSLAGPALLVLCTPFVREQVVFLTAAALVWALTLGTLAHRLKPRLTSQSETPA